MEEIPVAFVFSTMLPLVPFMLWRIISVKELRLLILTYIMVAFCSFLSPRSLLFLGNGTEDIVRRYQHPSRLLFFSIHLFDADEPNNFNFYPGTGGVDDYVRIFS
jgi:hypothetical protein